MSNIADISSKLLEFWGNLTSGNVLTAAGVDRKPTFQVGGGGAVTNFNTFGTDSDILFISSGLIINFGVLTPSAGGFTWTYPRAFTTAVFVVVANVAFSPNDDLDRTVKITAPPGLVSASGRVSANGSPSSAQINLVAFGF